jgi:hypothetical protein
VITTRFPRGKISCSYDTVPLSVKTKFPQIENWDSFTYLTVRLNGGARSTINGYGKHFSNPLDTELEGWVNDHKPIVQGVTLIDVLRQREFFLVVSWAPGPASKSLGDQYLPPAFTYGYLEHQPYTKDEMIAFVDSNPGGEFQPFYG